MYIYSQFSYKTYTFCAFTPKKGKAFSVPCAICSVLPLYTSIYSYIVQASTAAVSSLLYCVSIDLRLVLCVKSLAFRIAVHAVSTQSQFVYAPSYYCVVVSSSSSWRSCAWSTSRLHYLCGELKSGWKNLGSSAWRVHYCVHIYIQTLHLHVSEEAKHPQQSTHHHHHRRHPRDKKVMWSTTRSREVLQHNNTTTTKKKWEKKMWKTSWRKRTSKARLLERERENKEKKRRS